MATSLIIWPAAPFFLFVKGKDITIPQGTEITAFVDGDTHLDPGKFGGATQANMNSGMNATPMPAQQTSQTSLTVDSVPSGADIEVDGNFVGSTPSSIPVTMGTHQISVKKKGYAAWSRKMDFEGGNVHLNAELDHQ